MDLWEFIQTKMLCNPTQEICEGDTVLTFNETVTLAQELAKKLKGIKCCAILCRSEMAAAISLLGCFAAGVTALPLSVRYGELHCNKIIDTIGPDAVITDENATIQIKKIKENKFKVPQKHPALIMCTSGTTGKPKGIMLSEQNIITNVKDIADYFKIDDTDTILISRPIYHCAVLSGEFLTALTKGTKIRFYSDAFNPSKIFEIIDRYSITAFCTTPTLLCVMSRFNRKSKTNTLKHICVSGECMDKDTGLKISNAFKQSNIYHIYGLTEASPRVSYLPPDKFLSYPDCVGVPLKSVSIKIINDKGLPVQNGQEGMLWVKGENVMMGYYCDPQKTKEVLKNGWLCTGDVAMINDNGLLKIKGRKDNLIIKSGMNIYPEEIETMLKQDERVREVCVFGFNNGLGTQIGMKISGDFTSVDEVKRLCTECLPIFMVPTCIELVSELCKNGSGKIIRRL